MFERFTPRSRQIIRRANEQARRFRQAFVGTECILLGLLDDGPGVLSDLGIDREAVNEEVRKLVAFGSLHNPPRTLTRTPRAQRAIRYAVQEARSLKDRQVKPEHLLLGLLRETRGVAAQVLRRLGLQLEEVRSLVLRMMGAPDELVAASVAGEDARFPRAASPDNAPQHCITSLTQLARERKLDPVVGRSHEIDRLVQILCKRNKGNVVILGQAGVGKTALVEALAQRSVENRLPAALLHRPILSLDLAALIAGASHRGDVENRLSQIVEHSRTHQAILFIDEMHMLVKAGDSTGTHDVANLLKPVLARREIQCIGATTADEFNRTVGKNAALLRRFECLTLNPPDAETTRAILTALRPTLEEHHSVQITGRAISLAVTLSERYLARRVQPDKSIDLLDEAAARLRIRADHNHTPHRPMVDEFAVASVVATITRLPVAQLRDEKQRSLNLEAAMSQDVIGQAEAIARISQAVRRTRSGLADRTRPLGVFLLAGPGGAGKSTLARAAAAHVFNDPRAIFSVDLAGFGQAHRTTQLIGAAPGYVGHDQPGQLTEAVRHRPGSVILLENIDLAGPAVQSLLLQVMDHGKLTDSRGRVADFRHALVLLTCHTDAFASDRPLGFRRHTPANPRDVKTLIEDLFLPEFVNRLDDILIMPSLDHDAMDRLIEMELRRLADRLESRDLGLSLTAAARSYLLNKAIDADQNARGVQRVVDQLIRDPLSDALLTARFAPGTTIRIDCSQDALAFSSAAPTPSGTQIPA